MVKEVQLQISNFFLWSTVFDIFKFTTSKFDFEVVELSDDTEVGELTWGTLKSTGALDADFKSEDYYTALNGRQ